MARRRKEFGICKLCGNEGQLSYDHVPPRAVFNDGQFLSVPDEELYDWAPGETVKGKLKQGGIGFYSLCQKCNNNTGSWYGRDFVWWSYHAVNVLKWTDTRPTLYYPQSFFPLRVLKQILTMFFSISKVDLTEIAPDLVKFILNRDEKYMNPMYRVFAYFNVEGNPRYMGYTSLWNNGSMHQLSEIAYPPMGYVMTFDSTSPDPRLTDISHFSRFAYNDWKEISMKFPVLATHIPMSPGDYRSLEEIQKGVASARNSKSYRSKKN